MVLALLIIGLMEAKECGQVYARLKARITRRILSIHLDAHLTAYSPKSLLRKYEKILSRVGVSIIIFVVWSLALVGFTLTAAMLIK